MKWIASIVALFTALVSAQAPATKSAAAPAKRPTKQYTMEQFPDTTSIQDGYFPGPVSDDEKWLALDRPNTTSDSDDVLAQRQVPGNDRQQ